MKQETQPVTVGIPVLQGREDVKRPSWWRVAAWIAEARAARRRTVREPRHRPGVGRVVRVPRPRRPVDY